MHWKITIQYHFIKYSFSISRNQVASCHLSISLCQNINIRVGCSGLAQVAVNQFLMCCLPCIRHIPPRTRNESFAVEPGIQLWSAHAPIEAVSSMFSVPVYQRSKYLLPQKERRTKDRKFLRYSYLPWCNLPLVHVSHQYAARYGHSCDSHVYRLSLFEKAPIYSGFHDKQSKAFLI